ncbi:hypothetical protein U8L64_07980 [Pseudomonas sp. FIP_A4]|jgi:hypothetical protein|uniref:hypothetical protein n=1 Tax=Pseudomonas sp. FIP_A4 TaxID=3070684 RepID=UPI00289489CE|nr:hypothetical protein [Pseudomonadaceae bacterium]
MDAVAVAQQDQMHAKKADQLYTKQGADTGQLRASARFCRGTERHLIRIYAFHLSLLCSCCATDHPLARTAHEASAK